MHLYAGTSYFSDIILACFFKFGPTALKLQSRSCENNSSFDDNTTFFFSVVKSSDFDVFEKLSGGKLAAAKLSQIVASHGTSVMSQTHIDVLTVVNSISFIN